MVSSAENGLNQHSLFGLDAEKKEETVLDHVIIESSPTLRKNRNRNEWHCIVHQAPDIFNQERSEHYEVHAKSYALEAKSMNLAPGDVVTLKGSAFTQEIDLAGGGKKTVKHLTVTNIEVHSRAGRTGPKRR